jgi:hypothetical protein
MVILGALPAAAKSPDGEEAHKGIAMGSRSALQCRNCCA